jgi:type II secretory pathway component PulF
MAVADVFRSEAYRVGAKQSVLWSTLGMALMRAISSFEKIFKDFGYGELPAMTVIVLNVGHFLVSYWYLGLLPIFLWPFMNWAVVSLMSENPVSQRLWRVAMWYLPFVCAAFVLFALFRPLITLTVKLSS